MSKTVAVFAKLAHKFYAKICAKFMYYIDRVSVPNRKYHGLILALELSWEILPRK